MPQPARWSLPANPDLSWLRKRAKQLRDAATAGDRQAHELIDEYDPPADQPVTLTRAQRVIARAFGFAGWSKLREHLAMIAEYARPMEAAAADADPADHFLRLACLTYTEPSAASEAERLLAAHPDLAYSSVYTLSACGRAPELAEALASDPDAVSRQGGPHRWVPLLYLCYSRVPQDDARASLEALLAAGADPNAGFLWKGATPPFTALTGVLGGGERDEPPHADAVGLAEMLLTAGADPNDDQALYNRAFRDDHTHLPPLLAHGLGQDLPSPWRNRFGMAYPSPRQSVGEHLRSAAANGYTERVRLLLDHGVDPNTRGYHPILGDRTAYEVAVRNGHRRAARLLARAGGHSERLDAADLFVSSALAGDRRAAAQASPATRAAALSRRADAVATAAQYHGLTALQLLAGLGFDLNAADDEGRTALHQAALDGDAEICQWLIAHGADRTLRDRNHHATPAQWATHAGHHDLAARLKP